MNNAATMRLLPPLLGVAALFAVQFINFLEGRGLVASSFPLLGTTLCMIAGILCGSFFFSRSFLKAYSGVPAMILATVGSMALWGLAALHSVPLFCYGASFLGGMPLPTLLAQLFSISRSPGLHLGTALACGDFFWLFLLLAPSPVGIESLWTVILVLQCIGGTMAVLCLTQKEGKAPKKKLHTTQEKRLSTETLTYLSITVFLFFFINNFADVAFYRMHAPSFPIPAQVHLYIWIIYPLAGLYIDKNGADIRLLLVCIAATFIPPTILSATEGTVLYWGIYTLDLSARGAALLYFTLVFAHCSKTFRTPETVFSIPYIALLATFVFTCKYTERFPGTVYITCWSLVLTASFSFISSRIQYALTLSGLSEKKQKEKIPQTVPYQTELLAMFSEKYGLSTREQDVLRHIASGDDTTTIGLCLHLSENTIKTHVRQLLRKTETRNRIALAALFFNESNRCTGASLQTEDTPPSSSRHFLTER